MVGYYNHLKLQLTTKPRKRLSWQYVTAETGDMKKCNCDFCKYNSKVNQIIDTRDPVKLIALIQEMRDRIIDVEEELGVLRSVMDGSWPSAVEQLTAALERAENHPNLNK